VAAQDVLALLGTEQRGPAVYRVEVADPAGVAAHHQLRRAAFVDDQGLFAGHDRDDVDDDPRTVVLVARTPDGSVLGGVRLAPCTPTDIGWWAGSRLVCSPARGVGAGSIGAALVRAAAAHAEDAGVLRFDACVQARHEGFFVGLGWQVVGRRDAFGAPHVAMRWPIGRLARQAEVKAPLGALLAGLRPGGAWLGDDGVPVPGSDVVAATDAIVPAMVARDPTWAGWCGVLVNVNDLAAMGAPAVGLLDSLAAPDAAHAAAVVAGLRAASEAWGVPVLGGHTQLDAPAALSVTALGRTRHPVPGGGARVGDPLAVVADLGGGWRPGYAGAQWDSTSHRSAEALRGMHRLVAEQRPAAAKDVSMAGLAGTLGMLAEASGTGAEIDVAAVPRPAGASLGDWLTCFPGYAVVTAGPPLEAGRLPLTSSVVGRATTTPGVVLRWPDGVTTPALPAAVTGLGPAAPPHPTHHRDRR
jgi:putative N-acetyltransferase (TIGR04045 family)